ncbi:class I SAM-dependent methyltransferase [Salipiger sp. IMCC34102]|uniref:class I SAM-dependent methyltransferase n=1 Tax=Salipiger sp. IMCC34102 TaxID=2510647 RepID=UPI00101C5E16|nr:methyltransferase [Salipiger sp. IMCC34102]RYH02201.1 class I SAM-dependent methyltransferase [Salipiger sp. IMCC34102]
MASQSRLATALDDAALRLPEGPAVVLRPEVETDLAPFGGRDLTLQHSDARVTEAFTAAGHAVVRIAPDASVALVVVPRFKALARGLIAQATASADFVLVDGQRTDGIDSLFKACRARLGDLPSIPKAKGRLFWFAATDAFADWAIPEPQKGAHGFYTTAGVFSDGEIDKGSKLLGRALPEKLPARMADLGAGWGYLSDAVLTRRGVAAVDLVEAEGLALDCARLNVTDPRASFHWADALTYRPAQKYDGIVMNPPFHTGSKGTPALGQQFIAAAARMLTPNGHLWMVANRHLPYEAALNTHFRRVEELPGDGAFKLFHASRPQTP